MEDNKDVVIEICSESTSALSLCKICINFPYYLDCLEALLEERFDSKAFATRAIQSQVVGETLKKLSEGILGLNEEIRSQVCISNLHGNSHVVLQQIYTNHEDLLSQATGIESLEGS